MTSDQKASRNTVLYRIGAVVVLSLSAIFICGFLVISNWPRLALHLEKKQWEASKPSTYYMQVVESRPDGGFWRWEVYVQESRPITVTLLETGKYSNRTSWLDPANLTVEQIFNLIDQSCVDRGFLDCGFESDPQYHYPKQVDSYELITIKVENFTPCEQGMANCLYDAIPRHK